MVKQVQEVASELNAHRLRDWEILLHSQVDVRITRTNHWALSGAVSECEESRCRQEARVVPLQSRRACGLWIVQRAVAIRSRTRRTGSRVVCSIKSQRKARLPGDDRVCRPVPDQGIHRSGKAFCELLATPKRQFVNRIGAQ